ncbi:MAG: NAD(P)H-hydrate dehydratase [Nanoarchaeota archaeon]
MQYFLTDKRIEKLLKIAWARKKTAKKGDSGRVLIIGGSAKYTGCLALAGISALRAGCDWVTIAAPERAAYAVSASSPDLVVEPLEGLDFHEHHWKILIDLIEKHDVVIIGTGMSDATKGLIAALVYAYPKKKKVLDAQALHAVKLQDVHTAIFTPHKVEYADLLKNSKIKEEQIEKKIGNNVLLKKGAVDAILSSTDTALNRTGNPGMAKAGTGDVLAGLCAGFLAQGLSLFDSACLAAFVNGLSGDLLKAKKGYSYIASDLHDEIRRITGRK